MTNQYCKSVIIMLVKFIKKLRQKLNKFFVWTKPKSNWINFFASFATTCNNKYIKLVKLIRWNSFKKKKLIRWNKLTEGVVVLKKLNILGTKHNKRLNKKLLNKTVISFIP